ncbi:N-acetylmuramoyl-L-alanine amidase [Natranaerovirga pectinivora]|uniref:N-acetylmuramoyl-L-alanine amidase n=1 Tax=Natranaerovirga pectinivora TaxID=682400 RepID=A0A4R3MRD1_9FIRM|nr:stalk domain-containing protein [Natranaerovirga pectinivora]TCT15721.1 N-acetylmuramoyl-L-alanine amidase [Natranaerovirga pectinivora]
MKKMVFTIITLVLSFIIVQPINAFASSYHMHTVMPGETYFTISVKHNRNLNSIQSINYRNPMELQPGDLVRLNAINQITVEVNNRLVHFDRQPYIENDRVFVPLRFISEALGVDEIKWLQGSATAQIIRGSDTIEVTRGSDIARINGRNVKLDAPVQLYTDRTFVPIRFFAEAFGITNIQWDNNNNKVSINGNTSATVTSTSTSYTEDELFWLARIVHAEASGEPYAGKLAVANVIINRKNSSEFPNSIYGVIFDRNHGVQFTPISNGTIYNTPNADSIRAAREALEGHNNIGNSLFFLNPAKATTFWITANRPYITTIAGHAFYL